MCKSAREMMMMMMLKQQMCNSSTEETPVQILTHSQIPDVLLLPVSGPRYERNVDPTVYGNFFKLSNRILHGVFLFSDLWSRSALRWWSALSVAALYWEALMSLPQGLLPAPKVRIKQHVFILNLGQWMWCVRNKKLGICLQIWKLGTLCPSSLT